MFYSICRGQQKMFTGEEQASLRYPGCRIIYSDMTFSLNRLVKENKIGGGMNGE